MGGSAFLHFSKIAKTEQYPYGVNPVKLRTLNVKMTVAYHDHTSLFPAAFVNTIAQISIFSRIE